jgi:hypothetical protein
LKALQLISDEYLEKSRKLSTAEILDFLEEFRQLLPESVYLEQTQQRQDEWRRNEGKAAPDQ